jgi:hypothetical protein
MRLWLFKDRAVLINYSVALLAQQYLLPSTITQVRQILHSNAVTPTYMGDVALWADEYRKEPGGEWSGGLHFINGKDAPPPESCKIVWPTDCPPEGCIVKAIGNYVRVLRILTESIGEI